MKYAYLETNHSSPDGASRIWRLSLEAR